MAAVDSDKEGDGKGRPPGFGGTIFFQQAAHVAVIDGRGRIIAVNDAWTQFGRDNGLDPGYQFIGVSYPAVCERAIGAPHGAEGAREALGGINAVLAAEQKRFSLIYPCHAPDKERWFLMYARPIAARTDGAVISHIDVTALKLAGLVPDETRQQGKNREDDDAATVTDRLARQLLRGQRNPLASLRPRLR